MDIRKSYAKSDQYAAQRNATCLILVPFRTGPFSLYAARLVGHQARLGARAAEHQTGRQNEPPQEERLHVTPMFGCPPQGREK